MTFKRLLAASYALPTSVGLVLTDSESKCIVISLFHLKAVHDLSIIRHSSIIRHEIYAKSGLRP